MRIIEQSAHIMEMDKEKALAMMVHIERCGRVCYQSEDFMKEESYEAFLRMLVHSGHESVLEHASVSFKIVCSRATANQLVRHRHGSFSQESTRYCNYSKGRFGNSIAVILPPDIRKERGERLKPYYEWLDSMEQAEKKYFQLLGEGFKPEQARGVLPLDLKTELVMTMNLRAWRHVLKTRLHPAAQRDIKELMDMIYQDLVEYFPAVFEDLEEMRPEQNG